MHALKVSTLAALVILEVGCGLPSPYFLSPPTVSGLFTQFTQTCAIQNANRSQDYQATFQGFELYYKFYGYSSDANFYQDQQYGTTSYTPTDLVNGHGFHRVTLGRGTNSTLTPDSTPGNSSAPLININLLDPADIANTFNIVITFNDSTGAGATSLATTTGYPTPFSYYHLGPTTGATGIATEVYYEVRRFLAINSSQAFASGCEFFSNNNSSPSYNVDYASLGSDSDVGNTAYTSSYANGPNGALYLMVYAVAYGFAGSQVVYSSPTYLGWTQINAFN